MAGYLKRLEKNRGGWIEYCDCGAYTRQSDPQNFTPGKQIIVTLGECEACKAKKAKEEECKLLGNGGLTEKTEKN